MKKIKLILIIFSILIITERAISFSEPASLAVNECVDLALENNLPVQIAESEIKLSGFKTKEAKRAFKPETNFNWEETDSALAGVPNSLGRRFHLELKQPLYKGGKLQGVLKQAEVDSEISGYKLEKIKNEIVNKVEKAYYPLAVSKLEIIDCENLLADAVKLQQLAEKKYALGLITKLESLKVAELCGQIKYKLKSAQDEFNVNKISLRHELNIDYDIEIKESSILEIKALYGKLEEYLVIAFDNRPDLKIDMLGIDFDKAGIDISRSYKRPSIEFTALAGRGAENFATEDFSYKNEWFLGLQFSKPWGPTTVKSATIAQDRVPQAGQVESTEFTDHTLSFIPYDKAIFKALTEEEAAKLEYENAIKQLEKTEKTIESEVKEAYYDYQKAIFKVNSSSRKIILDEEELEIINMQRKLDEKDISDLLAVKIKWQTDRTEYLKALRDLKLAEAKLKWAVGGNLF